MLFKHLSAIFLRVSMSIDSIWKVRNVCCRESKEAFNRPPPPRARSFFNILVSVSIPIKRSEDKVGRENGLGLVLSICQKISQTCLLEVASSAPLTYDWWSQLKLFQSRSYSHLVCQWCDLQNTNLSKAKPRSCFHRSYRNLRSFSSSSLIPHHILRTWVRRCTCLAKMQPSVAMTLQCVGQSLEMAAQMRTWCWWWAKFGGM